MKMESTIKQRWLSALTSGEYLQGKNYLKVLNEDTHQNEFCCLGVLCDVIKSDMELQWDFNESTNYYEICGNKELPQILPVEVQDYCQLPEQNPSIELDIDDFILLGWDCEWYGGNFIISLAELNDDGTPFDQIAKLIDKHF